MKFRADLHIHSCLSPCASLDMSPRAMVRRAREKGLNAVAIADHNCALNAPALQTVCRLEEVHCFFGVEVATTEDVHVLCLFDDLKAAMNLGQQVYDRLPDVKNIPEKFGDQVVVNEHDEVEAMVEKYLGNSADITFSELQGMVSSEGGLFIPAHIDKPVFSVTSQLGFLPPGDYPAIEATRFNLAAVRSELGDQYPVISNSDAHDLDSIGLVCNEFEADEWSLASFREALTRREVRVIL
jgi:PHP family Zn ribbon phosphoesterase